MTTLFELDAVTVAGYQLRTGDTTTAASAVSAALVEAEGLLEEHLRRLLAYDERDESCRIYPDGRIYPKAWPIGAAGLPIDGRALLGATPDSGPFVGVIEPCYPLRATVTYTGGFDDGTESTRLPFTLRDAIYDLAFSDLTDSPSILPGFTSATVGDVSVSSSTGGDDDLDARVPGITTRVRRYRNRWAA